MFLTNNSPDLCFLTSCIKIRQNNLYLASIPRISANLNKNYRPYNFQALANISGNFWKIYNPTYILDAVPATPVVSSHVATDNK